MDAQTRPRISFRFRLIDVALSLVVLLFLGQAAIRELNFDECLALRSGTLHLRGVPSAPPFVMPATLLLGALGNGIQDPGLVFFVARGVAAVAVLLGLALMARALDPRPGMRALVMVVMLLNGALATHAYEFRYDVAILIGWTLALASLLRCSAGPDCRGVRRSAAMLGFWVAWLAVHHVKGAFFGGSLCLFSWLVLARGRDPAERRRCLLLFHAVLAATLGAWVSLCACLGLLERFVDVYRTFLEVGVGAERVWPGQSLADRFLRDLGWWAAAAFLVAAFLGRKLKFPDSIRWIAAFAVVPVLFICLHPHPWAYMVVPIIPPLSLIVGYGLFELLNRARPRTRISAAVILLVLQFFPAPLSMVSEAVRVLDSPRTGQVEALRILRNHVREGDTVLDPSGLAYFVKPCHAEWYTDTLFQERMRRGEWMAGLEQVLAGENRPAWVLKTYRLRFLPDAVQHHIARYRTVPGQSRRNSPPILTILPRAKSSE